MKKLAVALTRLLLAACVNINVRDDGIARARLGETVYVDGPSVTPIRVLEDSRCPQDTECVWAGRVRIIARIALGAGEETRELTMGEPIQVADGALELVETYPAARADRTIYPSEYRFGFTFSGGI